MFQIGPDFSVSMKMWDALRDDFTKWERPERFGGQDWVLLFRIIQTSDDSDVDVDFHMYEKGAWKEILKKAKKKNDAMFQWLV